LDSVARWPVCRRFKFFETYRRLSKFFLHATEKHAVPLTFSFAQFAAHMQQQKGLKRGLSMLYSGRGKFMPLPLKSQILETPGFLVTDYIKMFPL
jgi:hypothetical protein